MENGHKRVSSVAASLRPSRIAALSRLAATLPGVLNLGEGFPDLPMHPRLIEALQLAATQNVHQHTHGAGLPALRQWIAQDLPYAVDAAEQITITCGATQALMTTLCSLINPGDEVILLEPFYEPYVNMITLAGGIPRVIRLHPPAWQWDDTVHEAFGPKTRAVLFNSPHNPTGRHFTRYECAQLTQLADHWGAWLIHDAVYSHWTEAPMVWPIASERLITIGSFSKSLGITGWRLGYVVAPGALSNLIREVHELHTCEAPVPLQAAVLHALQHDPGLISQPFTHHAPYRQALQQLLNQLGATVFNPEGAVYIWANMTNWGKTPLDAAEKLLIEKHVLAIPADSFYLTPPEQPWLRWCYVKQGIL